MSVGFLHHLITTRQAKAVVTARRGRTVRPARSDLAGKDGRLARLDLEPFEYHETEDALEAALGDPVEPRTARRLHDQSGGNVLMLRELVDAGRADGSLRRAHGAWVQRVAGRPSLRLVDLLADRIDDLQPVDRAAAELLALGEPIAAELFERVVAPDVFQRRPSLRLVQVERVRDRIVRSSHPLVAQVLVERMPGPHRDAVIASLIDLYEDSDTAVGAADLMRGPLLGVSTSAHRSATTLLFEAPSWRCPARTLHSPRGSRSQRSTVGARNSGHCRSRRGARRATTSRRRRERVGATARRGRGRLTRPAMRYVGKSERWRSAPNWVASTTRSPSSRPHSPPSRPGRERRNLLEARVADLLADCGHFRDVAPLAEARITAMADDEVAALCSFVAEGLIRTLSGRCLDTLDLCDLMVPVAMQHVDEIPAGIGWIVPG